MCNTLRLGASDARASGDPHRLSQASTTVDLFVLQACATSLGRLLKDYCQTGPAACGPSHHRCGGAGPSFFFSVAPPTPRQEEDE